MSDISNTCPDCGKPLSVYKYSVFEIFGTEDNVWVYCINPVCGKFDKGMLHFYSKDDVINMLCLLHQKYLEKAEHHDLICDLKHKEDIIEGLRRDVKFLSLQIDKREDEWLEWLEICSKKVSDLQKEVNFLCDWLTS